MSWQSSFQSASSGASSLQPQSLIEDENDDCGECSTICTQFQASETETKAATLRTAVSADQVIVGTRTRPWLAFSAILYPPPPPQDRGRPANPRLTEATPRLTEAKRRGHCRSLVCEGRSSLGSLADWIDHFIFRLSEFLI